MYLWGPDSSGQGHRAGLRLWGACCVQGLPCPPAMLKEAGDAPFSALPQLSSPGGVCPERTQATHLPPPDARSQDSCRAHSELQPQGSKPRPGHAVRLIWRWEELPKAASQGEMDGHVHPKCSPAKVEHRQVQEGASAEDGLGCGRPSLRASLRQLLGGLAQEDALNSTPPWNHWLAGTPVAGTSHDCCLPGSALAGPGLQSSVLTASVLL